MATVTEPILTDATGQEIVDKLDELVGAVRPTASDIPLTPPSGMTSTNVQDGFSEIKQSLSNLTLSKSVSGTTDANSNLNLNLSSNDYVVKSVYLSNRIAIPFIYNNNWYCSVRQTDSSMSPVANASVNGYTYYEKK